MAPVVQLHDGPLMQSPAQRPIPPLLSMMWVCLVVADTAEAAAEQSLHVLRMLLGPGEVVASVRPVMWAVAGDW